MSQDIHESYVVLKTLAALLGEADLLTGQLVCPRSPPDIIASFAGAIVPDEEWVVEGVCAYVPQVSTPARCIHFHSFIAHAFQSAWLRNASIRGSFRVLCSIFKLTHETLWVDNILFDLPYVEERYQKTLEVCSCAFFTIPPIS